MLQRDTSERKNVENKLNILSRCFHRDTIVIADPKGVAVWANKYLVGFWNRRSHRARPGYL
jgi:hypothetical protein